MQQLGQYVVSITAAALICGILLSVCREGTARSVIRLVCGIFLTITALSPMTDLSVPDFSVFASDHLAEGHAAASRGENQAKEETQERIRQHLEAYILDKASLVDAEITADILLSESGYPETVRLAGAVSDTAKQQLQEIITNDLGIPKENQQWIG